MWISIFLIIIFIFINGFFAATEIAVVTLRKSRIKKLMDITKPLVNDTSVKFEIPNICRRQKQGSCRLRAAIRNPLNRNEIEAATHTRRDDQS